VAQYGSSDGATAAVGRRRLRSSRPKAHDELHADRLFSEVCKTFADRGCREIASVDGAEEILIARVEAVINAATCLESFV
jgi:hypothetical protein